MGHSWPSAPTCRETSTFRELLGRVRESALGGYEHQDLPLELLVEALHPERDPSRTPLFQTMFVLQNNQMPDVVPDGLSLEPFGGSGTGTAKFDLSLAMAETPGGFVGSIEYATDLFDAATIGRMIGRFRSLLERIVADPDRRASDLDLASADDLRSLAAWNSSAEAVPPGLTLHGLFEAQVRQTPGAEAVAFEGQTLSYEELDRRAGRLARRLRVSGVGPESRVGIAMGRSLFDLAVALLGTLKAGAAYVPLDPAYPAEPGSDFMRRMPAARCRPDSIATISRLDVDSTRDRVRGRHDPLPSGDPASRPAYADLHVGVDGPSPRGVVVPHRSVVNHALDAARRFAPRAG